MQTRTLEATNFANDLIAGMDRQKNHLRDLANNAPWRVPANNNVFNLTSVNDWGACGEHADFTVSGDKPWNQIERLVFFGNGNVDPAQSFGNPLPGSRAQSRSHGHRSRSVLDGHRNEHLLRYG